MHGTPLQTCAHISEYALLNYVAKKCFIAKQDIRYVFKCKTLYLRYEIQGKTVTYYLT